MKTFLRLVTDPTDAGGISLVNLQRSVETEAQTLKTWKLKAELHEKADREVFLRHLGSFSLQ